MAKYYWQEDDDDDEEDYADETPEQKLQRERNDMMFCLELRKVNQDSLAQKFCEICERQKKLDDDKLAKSGRLMSEIEKDLEFWKKEKNKLYQKDKFSAELESVVENFLKKKMKDSFSAWQGLQSDIESLERTLRDYESRGDENTPEYAQYTKKLNVMNRLAMMKTVEQVEKYLNNLLKKREETKNKIGECDCKIGVLEQELNDAGQSTICAQVQKEWKDEEICLKNARIAFVRDMRDFAFARPQNEIVKGFEKMIADAYFYAKKIQISTMNEQNLDFVVKQVVGKKVENCLAIQKKTDTGR